MLDRANDSNAPTPSGARSRRPDFLGGSPIRLADGQDWSFPGPREAARMEARDRDEVVALLVEIAQAEDAPDRRRGELALAIRLLSLNYDLGPADFARLFEGPADSPILAGMQTAFHDLANLHGEALPSRPTTSPAHRGRRFRFPPFRPHAIREGLLGRGKETC